MIKGPPPPAGPRRHNARIGAARFRIETSDLLLIRHRSVMVASKGTRDGKGRYRGASGADQGDGFCSGNPRGNRAMARGAERRGGKAGVSTWKYRGARKDK